MKHFALSIFISTFLGWSAMLNAAVPNLCVAEGDASAQEMEPKPLPLRTGSRTKTSGKVPHVQRGVSLVPSVNDALYQLAFSLPGVEKRPTIVSLPGTDGMWLGKKLPVVRPMAIVAGREFAHIHPDGSLHAPLPYERALELTETGWGERHPWAERRDGWEGFVMLFTPQSMEELTVTGQLIVESYNYVTGKTIQLIEC